MSQTRSYQGLSAQGFHKLVYSEWGDPGNPEVVVAVHGLTRNRKDFDWMAQALAKDFRVICPDIVGRGQSDFLHDFNLYTYELYLSDLTALIARLNVEKVHWVGTSMGGILGLLMAALKHSPIKRMVLNDIGCFIPAAGLKRLSRYAPHPPSFPTLEESIPYFQEHLAGYGALDAATWRRIAENSTSFDEGEKVYKPLYDPMVASSFYKNQEIKDVDLRAPWEKVQCPCLVLHGGASDILIPSVAAEMAKKPGVRVVDLPGLGHAPALIDPQQIQLVHDFLKGA